MTCYVRGVIIKTFAVSQLAYLLTVLPNPLLQYFNERDTAFCKFVWSNKPDKIKRSALNNKR